MPADGGCYCPGVVRVEYGTDSKGMSWEAVRYKGGCADLRPVGHSTSPDTLSKADEERLMDLVLLADEPPGYDRDPYHEQADDDYDRFKDSRVAA